MPLWSIPMVYTVVSILCALILPRVEHALIGDWTVGVSVGSALAFFGAVASGMMALTGIVFAIAFVMVQFASVAYSPRMATVLGDDPIPFHTLGIFFATFTCSLAALLWTDREGSGHVPPVSALAVGILLVLSMIAFARLVQSLNALQIQNILRITGERGREVVRAMFPLRETDPDAPAAPAPPPREAATQLLAYEGEPQVIRSLDIAALVGMAERADALIVMECGVGETLVDSIDLLRVHGARQPLPEDALRAAIRLGPTRTFEQDPKYAIRLLVDIAIRALSAAINDPTTAVQALDQIEDLLRRLGRRRLDAGFATDATGRVRLIFPTASWEDYLDLAFEEIRQYGNTSLQVLRRLRSVLHGLEQSVATEERREAVRAQMRALDMEVGAGALDDREEGMARIEDRQGLGMSRRTAGAP